MKTYIKYFISSFCLFLLTNGFAFSQCTSSHPASTTKQGAITQSTKWQPFAPNASTVNQIVLQFDLNNILIKEWSSISLAQRTLKIQHISECCRNVNNYKTAGGYIWKYKN